MADQSEPAPDLDALLKVADTFTARCKTLRFLRKNLVGDGGLNPESPLALLLEAFVEDAAPLDAAVAALTRAHRLLREEAETARAALRDIDDVIWDGDSPVLAEIDRCADVSPRNVARCYRKIAEIAARAAASSPPEAPADA